MIYIIKANNGGMDSIVEIFLNGRWIPAAEFAPRERYDARFEYLVEYVFGDQPVPISFSMPVQLAEYGADLDGVDRGYPPFLLDLVPQGRGRDRLAKHLNLRDGEDKDLQLVQHGAFNPIGNLRVSTAVEYYNSELRNGSEASDGEGFAFGDIIERREALLEHIWLRAMLAAGTTGVQGAAPKLLLTERTDGRWFADAALPDGQAARHWLVKLPRGKHESDLQVLRNEAAYLRVIARCGLRYGGAPKHENDMLFVPRFDRQVGESGLVRLHQESLASLAGLRGFGLPISLYELVAAFYPHVTDRVAEVIEFLKRDILNQAMRNTDNHARNTAVQRLPDGRIQLTPVFDFAPMYLDRELIIRGCRWQLPGQPLRKDWEQILVELPVIDSDRPAIAAALRASHRWWGSSKPSCGMKASMRRSSAPASPASPACMRAY